MAGMAQVWLTEKELDALLRAAFDTKVKVSSRIEEGLRNKLLAAYSGVACKPAVELHEKPVLTPAQLQELARR
jgi:hypothetical protein